MITNNFNQLKWVFDASIPHSMTRPLVLDHINGGSGRYNFPEHYFNDVVCSVTIWDDSGGYWWVEGAVGDQASGHGTSDYEYDVKVVSPGVIWVYTDCPTGVITVNGIELVEMGSCATGVQE